MALVIISTFSAFYVAYLTCPSSSSSRSYKPQLLFLSTITPNDEFAACASITPMSILIALLFVVEFFLRVFSSLGLCMNARMRLKLMGFAT
jgi:hypothetical protein